MLAAKSAHHDPASLPCEGSVSGSDSLSPGTLAIDRRASRVSLCRRTRATRGDRRGCLIRLPEAFCSRGGGGCRLSLRRRFGYGQCKEERNKQRKCKSCLLIRHRCLHFQWYRHDARLECRATSGDHLVEETESPLSRGERLLRRPGEITQPKIKRPARCDEAGPLSGFLKMFWLRASCAEA